MIAAQDAFGVTIGTETLGLYSADEVRGFDPEIAGNVRIDGLYFDQQAIPSSHVVEGDVVHVGINALRYAFPSPTGIIDYQLKRWRDASEMTAVLYGGPFGTHAVDMDAQIRMGKAIQLPLGATYRWDAELPGSTSRELSIGVAPIWRPTEKVVIQPFWDYTRITESRTMPLAFVEGNRLPPRISPRYYGQPWALGDFVQQNYGVLTSVGIGSGWLWSTGLFRSTSLSPRDFSDLYLDVQPSGVATHQFVGYPSQGTQSLSGETRLTREFAHGSIAQQVTLTFRGREVSSLYGGTDTKSAGLAAIGVFSPVGKPNFQFGPRAVQHTDLGMFGVAYRVRWRRLVQIALGVQKDSYHQTVNQPGEALAAKTDNPWRSYASIEVNPTYSLSTYASFSQGLEDAGVAPANAINRGTILPATRTSQAETGVEYRLNSRITLIGDVFEITKPYFNLSPAGEFVELGEDRHRGAELSVSGELRPGLHVVAGALIMTPQVIGRDLQAVGIGRVPVGEPHRLMQLGLDYRWARFPKISTDVTVTTHGREAATVDDAVYLPSLTQIDIGARYRFELDSSAATLRLLLSNVTNAFGWSISEGNGLTPLPGRALQAYLTIDVF